MGILMNPCKDYFTEIGSTTNMAASPMSFTVNGQPLASINHNYFLQSHQMLFERLANAAPSKSFSKHLFLHSFLINLPIHFLGACLVVLIKHMWHEAPSCKKKDDCGAERQVFSRILLCHQALQILLF